MPVSDLESEVNTITSITLIAGGAIGASFILLMLLIMKVLFSPFDKVLNLIRNSVVKSEDDENQVVIRRIEYRAQNEFTPIVEALNDVNKQVKSYLSEIVENNAALQASKSEVNELNTALEAKVSLRTQQLEEKTKEALDSLSLLKSTQQQLIEHEKHASLGRLVTGVAHEINTPLGIAVTSASTLESVVKHLHEGFKNGQLKRSEFENYCEKLDNCAEILQTNLARVSNLVLSFKRISTDDIQEQDRSFELNHYLTSLVESLRTSFFRQNHTIQLINENEAVEVCCNQAVLTQVITHVVENAVAHGFSEKKSGEVLLSSTIENGWVKIRVNDNGKGMDNDTRYRVFDPFFTTTRGSGGTGLGLHIIYNLVVQKLQGNIECISEESRGATFIISFPMFKDGAIHSKT